MTFYRIDRYTILITDPREYVMDLIDEDCYKVYADIMDATKRAEEEAQND